MNISFRSLTEADLEIASTILVAAYQFTGRREAVIYRYLTMQPDGWWIVFADGVPVGYGGAVDYGPFSYIGMLSILPNWQHQGIGKMLTKHIMAWLANRGCTTMLLESKSTLVSFYQHLGFLEDGKTLHMNRKITTPEVHALPDAISPLRPHDIPLIVEFDAQYFGARRPTVLSAQIHDFPDRSFAAHDTARNITGYMIIESRSIGPWVASTIEVAEQLLRSALSLSYDGSLGFTIPASNTKGVELLTRYDFSQERSSSFMYYGHPAINHHREMIYAQTSPALG
jgi:GNAT superfamily N-acetyltransferase